jgi:membrane protein
MQRDLTAVLIGGMRALWSFAGFVLTRFARHEAPQNAAALTYTTLLSLVPLMTVTLAVFSAFPVADRVYEAIQDFVFRNFVPTSGEVLQQYLMEFSAKASKLSGTGALFLVVVAVLMMNSIDRALNAIWEVQSARSHARKFLVYWAVLSLGPLLIGASVVVTSYVVSLPILSEAASSGVGRRLLGLAPVITSAIAFTMIYAVVPNRRIRISHALVGGVFAALLFEVAKRAFGFYITQFPTYEAIYGALATVPIFLVWLYLSWLVVLLGAEVTHCLGSFRWSSAEHGSEAAGMGDAIELLLALDATATDGRAATLPALVATNPRWREPMLEDLLNRLRRLRWVHTTRDGGWALARPLDSSTLNDLYETRDFKLPREGDTDWPRQAGLAGVLAQGRAGLAEALDRPLAEFRVSPERPPRR